METERKEFEKAWAKLNRSFASMTSQMAAWEMWKARAALAVTVQSEPLVRFCPSCGHVGDVGAGHRDCCPDGNDARMIPLKLAEQCRDLFKRAVHPSHVRQA